jgi:hypothetical protein
MVDLGFHPLFIPASCLDAEARLAAVFARLKDDSMRGWLLSLPAC